VQSGDSNETVSRTLAGCAACRRRLLPAAAASWAVSPGCCREQVLAKKAFHHMKTIRKVRPMYVRNSSIDVSRPR
jgi:hypothetical protein